MRKRISLHKQLNKRNNWLSYLPHDFKSPRMRGSDKVRQECVSGKRISLHKLLALTRALRARRARPPMTKGGRFAAAKGSCFAAARAACVSTWLGELHKQLNKRNNWLSYLVKPARRGVLSKLFRATQPCKVNSDHIKNCCLRQNAQRAALRAAGQAMSGKN